MKELIDILYQQNYFSFKKDAKAYVEEIVLFVNDYNFEINVRETPSKFQKHGKKFLKYKANNQTTWYIFFDQKDDKFLVNFILNNHTHHFPELL